MSVAINVGNHASKTILKDKVVRKNNRKGLIDPTNTWEDLTTVQKDCITKHLAIDAGLIADSDEP